jgi:hypothetical protein
MRMETLNQYELSAKTDKTEKTKPSDPHGTSSYHHTYKENSVGTGDKDRSDFGQMFRASLEFPAKMKRRNDRRIGIDESMTFTEIKNSRKRLGSTEGARG